MGDETVQLDHGLVAPIALPPDAQVPEADASGQATHEDYDLYFRISRDRAGLLPWTRTCLEVTDRLLADLPSSDLTAEDQRDLLRGCLLMLQVTLSRWSEAAGAIEPDGQAASNGQ